MHGQILLLATVALLLSISEASCPNKCSGHGSCGAYDVCECDEKFLGGDCSQRQCPYTRAWVDTAQNDNDAHYYAECGNKGSCDRVTGVCLCDAGYTGSGCRRMGCPSFIGGQGSETPTTCSGHGTCEFIEELADDVDDKRIAGAANRLYTAWDQEKIMGCKCDAGYEGHDCASRMCPRGDDPLTGEGDQYDMQQYIQVEGPVNNIFLTYYDVYGNAWTTDEIDIINNKGTPNYGDLGETNVICDLIQTALRRLPNHALDGVTVAGQTTDPVAFTARVGDATTVGTGAAAADNTPATAAAWVCIVTFPSTPGTTGLQHLLGCTTRLTSDQSIGMQPMLLGTDATKVCNVGEAVITAGENTRKLTENAECSNRGVCDSLTGACACFSGHKGAACETQEALV